MIATNTAEPFELTCGVLRAIPLPSIAVANTTLNSNFLDFFNLQHLFQIAQLNPIF
jgi:hypothetical protein